MAGSQKLQDAPKTDRPQNGNFTFSPNSDYAFPGEYKKSGDTIIFDEETIKMSANEITTVYLLKSNKHIPLFDTTNKITFTVTEAK